MARRALACTVFAALTGLAACSSSAPPVPMAGAQAAIAQTDWSKSQTINVGLSSYAFTPATFVLKSNQPYVLHLVNQDDDTHSFSSDTLFSAVAVQKIVRGGVETAGMPSNGVSLGPKEQADLYLVPAKAGTYRIYCDEFMHDTMGMHGNVTIQ